MEEPNHPGSSAMLFERNEAFVVEAFRRGEFDYLEGVGEVSEADFFRAITARKVLEKLAATYPCGHILPGTYPCVFMESISSMLSLTLYAPAG
jgi:hypothetical protein